MKMTPICVAASLLAVAGAAHASPENLAFLKKNATAHGVVSLPAIQYQVLKSGPADGPHPTRASTIKVRYEGRLLNGKVFDSSATKDGDGTATFPLQKLIPGWITALQLMRPGDEWMLYLPPEFAYGAKGKETIPPDSVLVFKVELVGVTFPPPAAP
jgi:peptidylprolyl isomerase/FKBP-type peptidyl-prolyl cis-trans isomerase FklB